MRNGKTIAGLVLGWGLIWAVAAGAQPVVPTLPAGMDLSQPLTLAQCAEVALAASPALAIAGQQVRQAQAGVTQARAQALPQVSLSAGVTASGGALPGSTASGTPSTNGEAAVTFSQIFYQTGLQEDIRAAEASATGERHGLTDTRRSLLLKVAQDYYAALAAQGRAQVADRAVVASAQHLEAAKARIAAGSAAAADRYPFDVELQQAVVAQIQARNAVRTSLNLLKQTMGLPAEASLQLAESLGRPELPGSLEQLRQAAYAGRPDLLQQRAAVEAARLQRQVARMQQGPVLTVSGSDTEAAARGTTGNGWEARAGVSLPIFDAGASRAATDRADAALKIAEQSLRQLELAVSQEVENSYLSASAAAAQIEAAQIARQAAQVSADAAQERYQAGVGTVIDVTDAQQRLTSAETELVNALYSYNTSLIELQAAVGVPQIPAAQP